MDRVGIEPTTYGLRVRRSTTELPILKNVKIKNQNVKLLKPRLSEAI